jgi:tetratricopeptide (TPR) repeat protein
VVTVRSHGKSIHERYFFALALLLLLPSVVQAAFVCEAQVNRATVPAGEEISLSVTAEGDIGWSVDFVLPDLPGFQAYSGGTNQSMRMVNGQTTTTVTRTWYLRPDRPGSLTIGPVRVTARGETCSTEPLKVTVTAPQAAPPPADTGNRTPPPGAAQRGSDPTAAAGDMFLTLAADKDEVWLGEQIILTFRWWYRSQPWNTPRFEEPRTEGFWREDLGPERKLRDVRGGRAYTVVEKRYALFPTRAGELVIEPAELEFPEDVFDRFFNSRRRPAGPRVLRSERVAINVRPLPEPAPAGFSGLVANRLALTGAVSADSTAAGEPVELGLVLESDGFLKGFGGLDVSAPEGARMHDAAESLDTGVRGDRVLGRLEVEKVLVPERHGTMIVPPVSLVWFDAEHGRYAETATPARRVRVEGGRAVAPGDESGSGFMRSEIARLGDDLAFVHAPPRRLRQATAPFTGSWAWWLALAAPLVLLGAWRLLLNRWDAQRRDPAGRRRRQALGIARSALAAGAADPAAVVRAVCGYVADCTDRPAAAVDGAVLRSFAAHCGRPDVGDRLASLVEACDAARFGGDRADAHALAAEAASLLADLDRQDRRPEQGKTLAVLLALGLGLAAACPSDVAAVSEPADPVRLLAMGNQAYTEGDLDEAVTMYRAALAAGADDAVVHYNLGNAEARRGELGRAVAAYLQAARLDPRDPDIRDNLARVRARTRDLELTAQELPLFIAQFVAVVSRLTVDEWAGLTAALVWVLSGVVGWAWWRGGFGVALRRAGLGAAAGLLVCAAVTGWRWHGEQGVTTAVVVTGEVSVHSGPDESFPVLFVVHDGLTVRLDGARDAWVRVTLGGDWQGWLPREAVVLVGDRGAGAAQGL